MCVCDKQANVASLLPVPGNLVIVALLAPLVALAMLRNVAALAPFSLAADIAMISGAAAEPGPKIPVCRSRSLLRRPCPWPGTLP
jgi:hypothetical protein